MQGLWKTTIGGYNTKGSKRKKYSKKHLLKDKARVVRKLIRTKYVTSILNEPVEVIYGEIFENQSIKHWVMGNSHKDIKNIVERKVRASVRNWISKKAWDKERRVVYNEKSILWLID